MWAGRRRSGWGWTRLVGGVSAPVVRVEPRRGASTHYSPPFSRSVDSGSPFGFCRELVADVFSRSGFARGTTDAAVGARTCLLFVLEAVGRSAGRGGGSCERRGPGTKSPHKQTHSHTLLRCGCLYYNAHHNTGRRDLFPGGSRVAIPRDF